MNASIIQIDNLFHSLSTPDQEAWNTLAPSYAGYHICGCSNTITTGQELYRSVQYIRQMTGQSFNLNPIIGPPIDALVQSFGYPFGPLGGPYTSIDLEPEGNTGIVYCIVQAGEGNLNPVLTFQPAPIVTTVYPGDPVFIRLSTLTPGVLYPLCVWAADFSPCPGVTFYFDPP
jgi:hypothetical protein